MMLTLALLLACSAPRSMAPSTGQLDDLFVRLRSTASDAEAHNIELTILHVWAVSGRPEVDALMLRGLEMAHTGDLDGALVTFDRVVRVVPGFAEAYNQRAQVHVMRDEYAEAILDIQQVLALEPRHFGALSGLGRILMMYGEDQAALRCFDAALAINPHLDSVHNLADSLREQLAGMPI